MLPEEFDAPIISTNLSKFKAVNSSWTNDADIMDLANDDNFYTAWKSNPVVRQPWIEVDLEKLQPFNIEYKHLSDIEQINKIFALVLVTFVWAYKIAIF